MYEEFENYLNEYLVLDSRTHILFNADSDAVRLFPLSVLVVMKYLHFLSHGNMFLSNTIDIIKYK